MREPVGFEPLLAGKQSRGIASKPRDEGFAGGQLLQASAPLGSGRAPFGTASWRELQHAIGPGASTMPMHTSGFGLYVGRRQTRQQGVLACARDTTTGRQKSRKARMLLVDALEHARHGGRDIVDTRAGQPMLTQYGHSLVEIAAPVFAVGGRAAHLGDETTEQLGNRVACPGIRHRAPNTVDTVQREGPWREVMGMGLTGQDGQHLARTQAHTEVEPPEQAVGTGCLAQGEALESAGRFDPDDAESPDPIDDGVRARCFLDAKNPRE